MSSKEKESICMKCLKTRCPIELMIKARDTCSCPNYEKANMKLYQIARILHISERTLCRKTPEQRVEFAKRCGFKLTVFENNKRHFYRIDKE